jgi:hypothetical protein
MRHDPTFAAGVIDCQPNARAVALCPVGRPPTPAVLFETAFCERSNCPASGAGIRFKWRPVLQPRILSTTDRFHAELIEARAFSPPIDGRGAFHPPPPCVVAASDSRTSQLDPPPVHIPVIAMTDGPDASPTSFPCRADEPGARAARNPSVHAATRGFWRGFGIALLEALHESRSRQAAREIQYHQHLIDEARAFRARRAIGSTTASGSQRHRASTGADRPWPLATLPIKMAIVVAVLVVFGLLHIVGGVLLAHSIRSPGEAGTVQLSGD